MARGEETQLRFTYSSSVGLFHFCDAIFVGCSVPLVRPSRIDWNPSLTPQTIQINGHTIFYTVKGEGKPLLLIHGMALGCGYGRNRSKPLSILSVYALDLIGHGYSDRPKIPYSPETYIHFMRDFMERVGIEKATLIGNSMGGGIAWAMAILFPERVDRLILINGVPQMSLIRSTMIPSEPWWPSKIFLYFLIWSWQVGIENSIKWILLECVSDIKLITPEILNRQYQLSKIKGTTWVLYSTFKHAEEALTLRDKLFLIGCPTLLIWGRGISSSLPCGGNPPSGPSQGQSFWRLKKAVISPCGRLPMKSTQQSSNSSKNEDHTGHDAGVEGSTPISRNSYAEIV